MGSGWIIDAVRIASPQDHARVESAGYPMLHDGAGNIIAFDPAAARPGAPPTVKIIRNGKIVHSFVGDGMESSPPMVRDRPESIYTTNMRGLVHIAADRPADKPRGYHIDEVYRMAWDVTKRSQLFTSPLGFLAMIVNHEDTMKLDLLDLPLKSRQGDQRDR